MCNKRNSTHLHIAGRELRIDACIKDYIAYLNHPDFKTVASCCGHGVYPRTVLVKQDNGNVVEIISKAIVSQTPHRTYYRKDEAGYYFIPQIVSMEENKDNV